jgi:Holliday junction resolvase-like predicted endonuclease
VFRDRGWRILGTNVRLRTGEIDLLVTRDGRRSVVEVKTALGGGSPIDRVDDAKHARLWELARHVGADGVFLVEVRVTPSGARIAWSPG